MRFTDEELEAGLKNFVRAHHEVARGVGATWEHALAVEPEHANSPICKALRELPYPLLKRWALTAMRCRYCDATPATPQPDLFRLPANSKPGTEGVPVWLCWDCAKDSFMNSVQL